MRVANLAMACALGALPIRGTVAAAQVQTPGRSGTPEYAVPEAASAAGLRAGYAWDLAAFSVGGQVRLPVLPGLYVVPSGDAYFARVGTRWQLNLDAAVRLGVYSGLYSGAGLGVARRDSAGGRARAGLNVFAGFAPYTLGRRFVRPYIEARWLLLPNRSPFHLVVGFNVPLARS